MWVLYLLKLYFNSMWHFGFILVKPPYQQTDLQSFATEFVMTIFRSFTPNSFTPNRGWQLNYNLKPHHRNKNIWHRRLESAAMSQRSLHYVCNHNKDQHVCIYARITLGYLHTTIKICLYPSKYDKVYSEYTNHSIMQ